MAAVQRLRAQQTEQARLARQAQSDWQAHQARGKRFGATEAMKAAEDASATTRGGEGKSAKARRLAKKGEGRRSGGVGDEGGGEGDGEGGEAGGEKDAEEREGEGDRGEVRGWEGSEMAARLGELPAGGVLLVQSKREAEGSQVVQQGVVLNGGNGHEHGERVLRVAAGDGRVQGVGGVRGSAAVTGLAARRWLMGAELRAGVLGCEGGEGRTPVGVEEGRAGMKKLGEGHAGVLLVKEEMGRRHVVLVRRRVMGAEGGRARTSKGWEAQWEVWTLVEEPLGAGGGGGKGEWRRAELGWVDAMIRGGAEVGERLGEVGAGCMRREGGGWGGLDVGARAGRWPQGGLACQQERNTGFGRMVEKLRGAVGREGKWEEMMVEMSAALRGGVERRGVFEERKAGDAGCKGGYFWEPEGARMRVEVVATEARGGGRGGETEMWTMGAKVTLRKREGGVVEVRNNGEAGGRSDFGRREGMVVLGRLEEGRVRGNEAGDGACNFVCTGARRAAADVTLLTFQRGPAGAGGDVVRIAVHAREVNGRRVGWGEAVVRVALLCGGVRSGMAGAVVPSGLSVDSGGVVYAVYEWGWVTVNDYARDNLVPGGNKWTEVAGRMRRRVEKLLCALVGGLRAMGVLHRVGQGVGEVKLVVQPEVRGGGGLLLGGLVDSGLVGPTNEELVVVGRLAG